MFKSVLDPFAMKNINGKISENLMGSDIRYFVVVQSLGGVQLFATPRTAARQASLPSPSPGVCSNSCQWYHPTISSSVIPFSSHLQSFPGSGSFQMSKFFPSGGQSIGVSDSASVLLMNIQNWFPLGLTCLIPLFLKGLLESINSSALSFLYSPTLTSIHDHGGNHSLD